MRHSACIPLIVTASILASANVSGQNAQDARTIEKKEDALSQAEKEREVAFRELYAAYTKAKKQFSGPDEKFNLWWNTSGYLKAPEAKEFSKATQELEEQFIALEKLRNPQRFQKGFSETPLGMAFIPTDRYPIGPHTGWLEGFSRSSKERKIKIQGFYIDKHEVTIQAYKEFISALPASLRLQYLPKNWILDIRGRPISPKSDDNIPVTHVTWEAANTYAKWKGKRLPTEEEWEAAARGPEGRRYPFGNTMISGHINCQETAKNEAKASLNFSNDQTPLGIFNLSGNIREWTASLYSLSNKSSQARLLKMPKPSTVAISRGGSFLDPAKTCTSTFRWAYPVFGTELPHLGFRCARDLD